MPSSASRHPPGAGPNLYLIGFMGTGKTALGRRAADALKARFIDVDQAIEAKVGMPISRFFEEQGEPAFREEEWLFIESGHPGRGCVVSCGGGLAVQPGMMDRLMAKGVVVALSARPETILRRVSGNKNRPLLNVPDPEARIRDLLSERQPYYQRAHACIMTDLRPKRETLAHVLRAYKELARQR
ncbi:MAG: shikimate kinase [Opitutales bacterium]